MSMLSGMVSASLWAVITFFVLIRAEHNVPASTERVVDVMVLAVAITAGYFAGSTIARRARRAREHYELFSALAGAISGGLIGALLMVALDASYLHTYAPWPQSRVDEVLLVLSYPVLGTLGFALGAMVGTLAGITLGRLLRVVVRPAS